MMQPGYTAILAFVIGLLLLGNELFDGQPLDIQLHDTYFVLTKPFFLAATWIAILVFIYMARGLFKLKEVLREAFKKRPSKT